MFSSLPKVDTRERRISDVFAEELSERWINNRVIERL
jgi:hypothetical protein